MPYQVTEFQDTPNPNALKCVLDRPAPPIDGPGLRSYHSSEAAKNDPLAGALLALPGVVGVLINPAWITISKSPDADWRALKPALKKVLGALA